LETHKFALGPATDGGYYLFAGRAPVDRASWTNVTYSAEDTAEQLIAQLPSKVAILASMTDVDTADDLEVLKRQLQAETQLSDQQQQIIDWLDAN
jgi:uncharacterized protein